MNRRVALLGALDHDVSLGRALEIRIRGTRYLRCDRVSDLHLPMGAIENRTGLG